DDGARRADHAADAGVWGGDHLRAVAGESAARWARSGDEHRCDANPNRGRRMSAGADCSVPHPNPLPEGEGDPLHEPRATRWRRALPLIMLTLVVMIWSSNNIAT